VIPEEGRAQKVERRPTASGGSIYYADFRAFAERAFGLSRQTASKHCDREEAVRTPERKRSGLFLTLTAALLLGSQP
jgi:hypothetical protein